MVCTTRKWKQYIGNIARMLRLKKIPRVHLYYKGIVLIIIFHLSADLFHLFICKFLMLPLNNILIIIRFISRYKKNMKMENLTIFYNNVSIFFIHLQMMLKLRSFSVSALQLLRLHFRQLSKSGKVLYK